MSIKLFVLILNGKRISIGLEGQRTLAEILSDEEYVSVLNGSYVALTEGGGILDLSSPLENNQVITLKKM